MEFLAPFWNRLFYRCDIATQVTLLCVCSRIYKIGMLDQHLHARLLKSAPKQNSRRQYRTANRDECLDAPDLRFVPFEKHTHNSCALR
uniref:Uncharacterized protein n=1 Tax=viral metagenome TaxID=1070528 RepID=A0A6C0BMP1_9ZZZZ